MKNVIFIAPPAAGKGTLSKFLIDNYDFKHISTGSILRKKSNEKTLEAAKMSKLLATGELVDDEYIVNLTISELEKLKRDQNFILDGIPRNLFQAEYFEKHLVGQEYVVIHITTPTKELEKRITGRYTCPKCNRTYNINFAKHKPLKDNYCDVCKVELVHRSDDNINSFRVRYDNYIRDTLPILDFYRIRGKLYELDNTSQDLSKINDILRQIIGDVK